MYLENYIVDGEIKCKKWEQIFIDYDTFIGYVADDKHCTIEEAEKKYMMTKDEFKQKMNTINEEWTYNDFYNNEIKGHLSGYWHPGTKKFYSLGNRSSIWLVGGVSINFTQNTWLRDSNDKNYGFSGRLLKN